MDFHFRVSVNSTTVLSCRVSNFRENTPPPQKKKKILQDICQQLAGLLHTRRELFFGGYLCNVGCMAMGRQISCPRQEANHGNSVTIRSLRTPRKRRSLNGQTDKLSKAGSEPQQLCHNKVSSYTEKKAVLESECDKCTHRQAVQGRKRTTTALSQLGLFVHRGKGSPWMGRQTSCPRQKANHSNSVTIRSPLTPRKRRSLNGQTDKLSKAGSEAQQLCHN